MPLTDIPLDARKVATILVALRCYQRILDDTGGDIPNDMHDIATNNYEFDAMDIDEIEKLCDHINNG
jgi:hypothetical protein